MMHSFNSEFQEEREDLKQIDSVENVKETVFGGKLSILGDVSVLRIITSSDESKIKNMLKNNYEGNYIVESGTNEIVCMKEKDRNYEGKVLSSLLK